MIHFKEFTVETTDNNLAKLDEKLANFVERYDFFHLEDLTSLAQGYAESTGVKNGILTTQVLHTTCVISVNELHEPMLVGDINMHLRDAVPKVKDYLHNSKLRTANLCADDHKCDRNADAHLRAFLVGGTTQSLLIKDSKLVLGQWQRLALVDFDGPRSRKVIFQVMGE